MALTIDNKKRLLDEISKIKELFIFGSEILPFLEELFVFLQDALPLVEQMSDSLSETNVSMPQAQDNITAATTASENATNTIMNRLDDMGELLEGLAKLNVDDPIGQGGLDSIQKANENIFAILNALQFQDITSQQLSSSLKILSALHKKFVSLWGAIDRVKMNPELKQTLFGGLSPLDDDSHSNEISDIKESQEDKLGIDGGISQDDIDDLFN